MHKTIYPCFLEVLDANKVNCSDGNENTLLHMAVKTLQPDLCEILINCGANVEAINKEGNSPIFELFNQTDFKNLNDSTDNIIRILNILIDSGAAINKISLSGMTLFESASHYNSERLMLHLLSKYYDLKIVTESDFKPAFTNAWLDYSKTLIGVMPEDSLKIYITAEIFHLVMKHADPDLLESMFIKASSDVQQSIIEDLLQHFADKDESGVFIKLLETGIIEPKVFSNGETLLTSLLKDKNIKYCLEIINHAANRRCFNLSNILNEMPLQIAIETDLYDLICPLIFRCDQLNKEDNEGNTPLMQLYQKLSMSTDSNANLKLKTAVEIINLRSGYIYQETPGGIKINEFCSPMDSKIEIEAFQKTERNGNSQVNKEHDTKKICSICHGREVNCVFGCGYTCCMLCFLELFKCPICNAECTNPKYFTITLE